MGEAIITSRGGTQEEAVPVIPGYHSILATVRDYQGKLLKDYPINCKDGSVWYNYKTNETGKVLFTCNSGAANISINNVVNGYRYLDFENISKNQDAPIGVQTRLQINMKKSNTKNFSFGQGTSKITFLHDQECSGYLVGGGGGGSGGYTQDRSNTSGGSGGGGGYITLINNYIFESNKKYDIIIGAGGAGGTISYNYISWISSPYWSSNYDSRNQPGNAGASSTISNTSFVANGGAGGQNRTFVSARSAGEGYGGKLGENGGNSNYSFASGGGGGEIVFTGSSGTFTPPAFTKGGLPYGGNGVNFYNTGSWTGSYYKSGVLYAEDGKGPGGGGGAASIICPEDAYNTNTTSEMQTQRRYFCGGNGAAGICKLNMVNY